jgi:peptide/nickel transport system substrate-binding protein
LPSSHSTNSKGPAPNLAEIEFRPVEEPTTRTTTLRNGENDVIKDIPPDSWETVGNMDNASIAEEPGVGYFYLAFNCNEGPTTDPEVREAVDYAFSMDNAVERFVEPAGVRQYSPMPEVIVEDWDFPVDR